MIGSHSSSLGAASGSSAGGGGAGAGAPAGVGESRIYIISDSTYNSNLGGRRTASTASESLEMMTTASTTTQGLLNSSSYSVFLKTRGLLQKN